MTKAQQAAHDAATERWDDSGKRSRTAGLAEMCRAAANPKERARTTEDRREAQAGHKARLRGLYERALRRATPFDTSTLDRSKYFPHQSAREMSRRVRVMAAQANARQVAGDR